ncbi:nuclear factor 1 B-type [Platysternon megacephalum]|uniref:Nuclear factor 1 B-type n=1 Tax=Platysternon megacephalum TaxID=55544 RepID=A0A4D9F831_9SAUR|nr:nuclear factor 1 B-type [Platysternon megacephalum]
MPTFKGCSVRLSCSFYSPSHVLDLCWAIRILLCEAELNPHSPMYNERMVSLLRNLSYIVYMQYAVCKSNIKIVSMMQKPCLDGSNGQRKSYLEFSLCYGNKAYIKMNIACQ